MSCNCGARNQALVARSAKFFCKITTELGYSYINKYVANIHWRSHLYTTGLIWQGQDYSTFRHSKIDGISEHASIILCKCFVDDLAASAQAKPYLLIANIVRLNSVKNMYL